MRMLTVAAAATAVLLFAAPAGARAAGLPPCSTDRKATVNPKATPTGVDLNGHRTAGFDYVVSGCDLPSRGVFVQIEGLDDPRAASGTFEVDGSGIGYLHLAFARGAIPPGSSDVRVVIRGKFVQTSVLTLKLEKRSPFWVALAITLAACLGGLLLFGLRSLDTNVNWWEPWRWQVFQPVAGVLIVIAAVGAALGVLFAGLPSDWTAGTAWWTFLLKTGSATIGAATAVAATGAAAKARAAP